ncbi:MAG: hypothetical protein ACRD2N_00275 [Vicinamibacterales bacterium]
MAGRRAAIWVSRGALTAALLGGPGSAQSPSTGTPAACRLPEQGHHVLQGALDGWASVSRDALGIGATMPWLILVDEKCEWHLSPDAAFTSATPSDTALSFDGRRLTLFAQPRNGPLRLPNGRTLGSTATASTSVYGEGSRTFSVLSELEVWRRDPRHAKDRQLERFFQSLVIHELTHTTQVVAINRRLSALRGTVDLPSSVDDDIVQRRFQPVRGFQRAVDAERKAFYQAVLASSPQRRRALAARGLSLARERRARFYTGVNAVYRELEDIFLTLEGTGQWAVYRWARSHADAKVSDAAVVEIIRADKKYWSEDEGLALFLLIDALVPQWQARVLGEHVASPFALLEEAIGQ